MTKDKQYIFWFHYNKHKSVKAKKPQITLHYKNTCIILDNIVCNVKTRGKINKTQPFFVISGKTKNISINNLIATID